MRAYLPLCMLAYYLEWSLRGGWHRCCAASEDDPQYAGEPVGPLQRSAAAKRKDCTRQSEDGSLPLQSLAGLLAGLGMLCAAELHYQHVPSYTVPTLNQLEPLHECAFALLDYQPHRAPNPPPGSGATTPATTPT